MKKMWNKIDLRGMGGSEKELQKMFPHLKRISAPLYDFIDEKTGKKIEIKKTANKRLQSWIDPTKYTDLTKAERKTVFRFVYYDSKTGTPLEVVDTTLGEIVDRFCPKKVLAIARTMNKTFSKRGQSQWKLNILYR